MSEYSSLKATINANIKANNNHEITGAITNSVLNAMVNTLGAGYQFAGVATTATNPGTPDAKVFYIANGKGTYTNFGGINVTEDEVVVLYWDTAWHKEATGIASQAKLSELFQQLGVVTHVDNVDNLPTGVVCFTSVNPPSGLPNWVKYGGGAMIITIRQNNDTLTAYDKQFLVTPGDMPAFRTYYQGGWSDWDNLTSDKPQFIQDELNPPAIDNLPNGVRCFTSTSVPQGYPQISYAGGAMIITFRQNNNTLQSFDRQYIINSGYFCEHVYWVDGWQEWDITKLNAAGRTITCGVGKDFSRLRDAVGEAIKSPNNTVIVYPGVYDLAEEFSEEIANHSGSGISLRNNIHIYFMPGAYVKCLIDVSNDWAYTNFEPFYVKSTLDSDFTIENMDIVAKNCHYCVHDEHYGNQSYHHRYINCQMDMTSEHETPHFVQCIGGGLGEHGYVEIIGGVYSSHATHGGDSSQLGISYHNGDNANADSKIVIKDVYLKDKGYIRFGAYGPSEKASKALVCGCSFGQPIANIQEISGGSATLFDLLEWNNELRTQ